MKNIDRDSAATALPFSPSLPIAKVRGADAIIMIAHHYDGKHDVSPLNHLRGKQKVSNVNPFILH